MSQNLPITRYATLQLASATVTKVGTLVGRKSIQIQNLDAANVYVGFDANVSSTNFAACVFPNGSTEFELGLYQAPQDSFYPPPGTVGTTPLPVPPPPKGQVYVYSVAGTSANAVAIAEIG